MPERVVGNDFSDGFILWKNEKYSHFDLTAAMNPV